MFKNTIDSTPLILKYIEYKIRRMSTNKIAFDAVVLRTRSQKLFLQT